MLSASLDLGERAIAYKVLDTFESELLIANSIFTLLSSHHELAWYSPLILQNTSAISTLQTVMNRVLLMRIQNHSIHWLGEPPDVPPQNCAIRGGGEEL